MKLIIPTLFYDVDTQNDFMNKDGALYVPKAESIKGNLEKLTKYACLKGIPIFGSVDKHFGTKKYKQKELELQKWGGDFPEHCMNGTYGQLKIGETNCGAIKEKNALWSVGDAYINNPLEKDNATLRFGVNNLRLTDKNLADVVKQYLEENRSSTEGASLTSGIYFEKQSLDVTTNPLFDKVFDSIKTEGVVVYGVATDYCVKAAVEGLLKHNIQVYLVTDAIKGINSKQVKKDLAYFKDQGVKLVTTRKIILGK